MKSRQPDRKSVRLFIIWIISCLGLNLVSVCKRVYQTYNDTGITDPTKPDAFFSLVLLLTAIYFVPLLFVIHRRAKVEEVKWLVITAKVLLIHFVAVLIFAVIILLCTFLFL